MATPTSASVLLVRAIRAKDSRQVRELLKRHPDLARFKDTEGNSALLLAAYADAPAVAEILVKAGAPVNIFEAAALGKTDMVQALLNLDPRLLRARSHDGWSLLHLAAFFGHLELARWLIGQGADLEAVSANALANRPLHSAVAGGRFAAAKVLLRAGVDVNATAEGWTPLHMAAHGGDRSACELLLAFGARTDVAGPEERSPADLANAGGHGPLAEYLKRF